MPAPPVPASPEEIDLGPDDLIVELDEHTTSQTRRLDSKAVRAATLELEVTIPPDEAVPVSIVAPAEPAPAPEGKPASKPYLAGDVIDGKYRLTRIIGRGGMGAVWQGHNIPLDIDIAIKLIRRDRTAPGAPDRLLTEARAAARLVHPAIVRVFDFGETSQGDPYIVMELLRGESLNAILRRKKRLTPAVAVQTMLPVAAALASAHGKSIIHRDLKPDNIILTTDETGVVVPKIVDFGIAKLLSPDVERHVTLAGEVLGSPDYMSPEQARGSDSVGEATDVWTFSVVLYELVTGRRPFEGANYNALIASIITDTPQPITAHGVHDAALAGIIDHGLAKDVAARWPRMRDMGAALASWAVAQGIEDDVMGNPIAKQWLSRGARRLLTVQPETGGAPLRSGLVEPPAARPPAPAPVAPPAPRPAPAFVPPPRPEIHTQARVSPAIDARRASARRAVLLTIGIVLLGALAVALFLLRDRLPGHGASADPSSTASSAPSASAETAPTGAPSGADSASGAEPGHHEGTEPQGAGSSDALGTSGTAAPGNRPPPTKYPRRFRAPSAPKHIKF